MEYNCFVVNVMDEARKMQDTGYDNIEGSISRFDVRRDCDGNLILQKEMTAWDISSFGTTLLIFSKFDELSPQYSQNESSDSPASPGSPQAVGPSPSHLLALLQ